MTEPPASLGRIAILWRGDKAARRSATPETSRFKAVFAALADVAVDAEPVVYEDDVLDAVRAQLAAFDGVLVWVNPIHAGEWQAAYSLTACRKWLLVAPACDPTPTWAWSWTAGVPLNWCWVYF